MTTPTAQRAAWRAWAAAHPDAAQANRDRWAKSPAGRAWLKKNQKKKNRARDAWRRRQRQETTPPARRPQSKRPAT